MSPILDAFLRSWPFDPWFLLALLVTAAIYIRGHRCLQRRAPDRWHGGQMTAFLGGLAAIYLALASPIEPFASLLLQVHMLQHLLLMMVAPPLIWMGAPLFPFIAGLPRAVRVYWIIPLFQSRSLRTLFRGLTHPFIALPIFVVMTWMWHVPALYDLAVRSDGWHYLQHVCFLVSALLFWYPVVRPYPSKPRWSPWVLLPYLILADIQNTILGALLTFTPMVLYPFYTEVPRLGSGTALEDQVAAGVIMWVPGSIAFLLPLFGIAVGLLSGKHSRLSLRERPAFRGAKGDNGRLSLPVVNGSPEKSDGFDVLKIPILGGFLKWRHARLCLQLPLLLLAGIVIYDGLNGPEVGPMNLAGVLPWIHWRGLLVLGLLVAGNVFCFACPFVLPRTLARRWLPAGFAWPRWLRNKWLPIILLLLFFWAYEACSLWDSPWWTAWIAIGYFALAFAIDSLFRGGVFCKYVCPIGQFNFVQSLASPLEIKARDPEVCASCETKDCIRGRDGIPGCELHLFVPRKAGNMDCTTCLDCVHACPHDNIGLVAGPPAAELWHDRQRSGIGRFSRRPDLAALVLVLVFAAFANAAGMVAPVVEWQRQFGEQLGIHSHLLQTTIFYGLALAVVPLLTVGLVAALSRRWAVGRAASLPDSKASWQLAPRSAGLVETASRYAFALIPLGFGMWLAHYTFHFVTSYQTIVPTTERFVADLGLSAGDPSWVGDCCRPAPPWLLQLEIVFLDVGLLLSLYCGYRIAVSQTEQRSQALKALIPWAVLMMLLFAVGIWILFQPMQMRGTIPG